MIDPAQPSPKLFSFAPSRPAPLAAVQALALLRVTLAVLLFLHGLHRAFAGSFGLGVGLFGTWLESQGLPFGLAIAWGVTVLELVGPPLLLLGRLVAPLSLAHAAVLAVGMVMVHLPAGWFVVGAGRNGMEYSVLLIAALLALAWAHRPIRG